jgi:hypothetical protein
VAGADDFVMASRVSILLRGMGTHLLYPTRASQAWLPLAKRTLKETAHLGRQDATTISMNA